MAQKSTIVLNAGQREVRTALVALERLSPRASGAVFERLWFRSPTPPRRARRNRHPIPAGAPFRLDVGTSSIRGMHWGEADAPLAVLVHGWGGWWQQYGTVVPLLLERGYRVVAYDSLGHGDSDAGELGRRSTTVPEMARVHAAVAERFGAPSATIAHSIGCLAVMWAQQHLGVASGRQVFIAPATGTRRMLDTLHEALGVGAATERVFLERFERRIGRPLSDFDLPRLVASSASGASTLVIHDRDDRVMDLADTQALVEGWPAARLVVTEGFGHYRVLRAEPTLDAVDEFLDSALARDRTAAG